MLLTLLTPDRNAPDELAIVNQLLKLGLDRLHIRKPQFNTDEYNSYLNNIEKRFHSRVIICGSFPLYRSHSLGGIHLNTAARNDQQVIETINDISKRDVSTSFHSWKEIQNCEVPYGHVFISPVFDSISKPGYKGAIALEGIDIARKELKKHNRHCPKIIGLGGVDEHNIPSLIKHKFDGAALLGSIWNAADPIRTFKRIKEAATFPQL